MPGSKVTDPPLKVTVPEFVCRIRAAVTLIASLSGSESLPVTATVRTEFSCVVPRSSTATGALLIVVVVLSTTVLVSRSLPPPPVLPVVVVVVWVWVVCWVLPPPRPELPMVGFSNWLKPRLEEGLPEELPPAAVAMSCRASISSSVG